MSWIDAHAAIGHPSRDRLLHQARDDNPDVEQRDAARNTLVRLATGFDPPTPEDLALRAHLARHGCCGGGR